MQVIEKVKVVPKGYNGAGMLDNGSTNINVLGATAGSGSGAPTAFQAWEKSCENTLALQGGLYQWALTQQNQCLKIEND